MFMFVSYVTIFMTVVCPAEGQLLSFCQDPIEGKECNITCTTQDHSKDVSFLKTSDATTTIALCSSGSCSAINSYIISQPTGTTTVLSFNHTRSNAEEWQCEYGSATVTGTMRWGTYPSTITATDFPTNTNITSEQEADVKLTCLYSENAPKVTLIHTDSGSTIIASSTPVTCTITNETCADSDFNTYTCKVVISPRNDLPCAAAYSLGVSVTISNIQTPSISSALGTGITYECSTSSQSGSDLEWWGLLIMIIGSICSIIFILYATYGCSNKNCKTHAKCWKCSRICHTDFPLVTGNSLEEWNIEHYCCLNSCCSIKGCNKKCCSCFFCCGCCMIEFPVKRVMENSQTLTIPPQSSCNDEQVNNTKRKKKKKKAKDSVKENNDEPNPPVGKHTKEEKAVHTATVSNTKSDPNPPGER